MQRHKSSTRPDNAQSKRRNTTKLLQGQCDIILHICYLDDINVEIIKTKASEISHSHTLEDSVSAKLNIFILNLLVNEAARTYADSTIRDKFIGVGNDQDRDIAAIIGGRFLSVKDIVNAKNKTGKRSAQPEYLQRPWAIWPR